MLIKSIYRKASISASKARLIVNKIRKLPFNKILIFLNFFNTKSSKILKKIFLSALANAKNNFNLDINKLKVLKISVDKAFCLKRVFCGSKGRTSILNKCFSNILLVITTID